MNNKTGFCPGSAIDAQQKTGWWQLKYFLFSPLPGEIIKFEKKNQLG